MTTRTPIYHTGMIKHGTNPGSRGMAGITWCGRRNMGWPHARGNHAIMTRCASTIDLSVVHRGHWHPTRRCMTGVTLIRGINMCCGFSRGRHAIVTALAGTTSLVVVHARHRHPARINMAGLTQVSGINMRYATATFACSSGAIMTTDTRFRRRAVIKDSYEPHRRNVADITGLSGRNMCCTFADSNDAVVTTFTGTGDLCMVHT